MSNISNLVTTVNSKLTEGYSIAAIEREFKLGKDTLRKQLNSAGYKYVKEKKLFVLNEKAVTQTITHNITQTENSECNTSVTQDITQNNQDKKIIQLQSFSPEDISIIFELIQNYKLKNKANNLKYERNESEIITRSFRSYKDVLDSFSDFCKEKNLSQKDALADALMLYMKTAE